MQPLNQFDRVAFLYDAMARLVFGKTIAEAQKYFLKDIADGSLVLILGGGTGRLAKELLKAKPNCRIVYVEASSRMIELARKETGHSDKINFFHGTEENIPAIKFDVVITNFYLDMFTPESLAGVSARIKSALKTHSLWIATDFVDEKKWWQALLLKLMYWFFRSACRIESQTLPDWKEAIENQAMIKTATQTYYAGFIHTVKYTA